MKAMLLNHKDSGSHNPWGIVYFGVVLPKVREGVFQLPPEEKPQRVAIKRLSRAPVIDYVERGGNENPFREIQRMRWLGDNHHVLGIIEALYDENFFYIIMPYCEGGSLWDWIIQKRDRIHDELGGFAAIYSNILENVEYLRRNGVCHRDLSPDNCMVLGNGRIVFIDLAMSFRIPLCNLTTNTGFYGKPPYLPPEIVSGFSYFEATGCDLWSSVVILFNLVTALIPWSVPLPTDRGFCYLVLAGGLSRVEMNERATFTLDDDDEAVTLRLRQLAERCEVLNPAVSAILQGVLTLDPNRRWDSSEVHNSLWLEAFRHLGH
mmetsp:Transcript_9022/g.18916  ORF Transcript_9022/g.18916 Transcript_9022/m.18916 type:complete len:320 (+) Transcript_9022:16-975(+)